MLGAVVVCLAILVGCKADVDVLVDVRPDGSGEVVVTVALDAQAASAIGDVADALALDDLTEAGWKITGPTSSDNGQVSIVASHSFVNLTQATGLLESLTGPAGPLRDVALGRSSSFASTDISVDATVDLSAGLATFDESALTEALGGTTVSDVVASLSDGGELAADQLTMTVRVSAAGMDVSSQQDGGVTAQLGDPARTLQLDATDRHTGTLILAGGGLLATIAAVWLFFFEKMPITRSTHLGRKLRKQRHSARHGWKIVEQRTGIETPPSAMSKSRRGKHARPRGKHARRR